jgi:hypothetical protein
MPQHYSTFSLADCFFADGLNSYDFFTRLEEKARERETDGPWARDSFRIGTRRKVKLNKTCDGWGRIFTGRRTVQPENEKRTRKKVLSDELFRRPGTARRGKMPG